MPSAANKARAGTALVEEQPGLWRLQLGACAEVVAGVTDRTSTLDILRQHPACSRGFVQAEQVHGTSIAAIEIVPPGACLSSVAGCDALLTSLSQLALTIRTADCLPLYVWDAAKRVIGLAHVGWRGVAKQLPMRLASFLRQWYQSRVEDVWWGLGPAIRACCYEVGPEFEARFHGPPGSSRAGAGRRFVTRNREGRRTFDLAGAAIEQLQQCGMRMDQVLDSGVCTACDRAGTILAGDRAEGIRSGKEVSAIEGLPTEEVPRAAERAADRGRWFSVRREGDATGRLFSFIALTR